MSVLHFRNFFKNNSCVRVPFKMLASRNKLGSRDVTSGRKGRHGIGSGSGSVGLCDVVVVCDGDGDGVARSVRS